MTTTLTTAVNNSFTALVYTLPPQWVVENKKLVLSEQSLWTWNCFCFSLSICCLSCCFFGKAIAHDACVFPLMNLNIFFTVFVANCVVSLFHQFCFCFFFHSFCCLLCCCFVSASLTYWAPQSCAGKSPFHLESRCLESRSCKETAKVKTAFSVAETLMRDVSIQMQFFL